MILTLGSSQSVLAVQGRCDSLPQHQFAVGACVAAEDEVVGSGPVSDVHEVSSRVKSTGAFENLNPATPRNFVFDPENEQLLVGEAMKDGGHWGLATSVGMNEDTVVGGELIRGPDGEYLTNEESGHYGVSWTDSVRQQFGQFMASFGFTLQHTPWGGDVQSGGGIGPARCGALDRIAHWARPGNMASALAHDWQWPVGGSRQPGTVGRRPQVWSGSRTRKALTELASATR
jgi:hypothetical protein